MIRGPTDLALPGHGRRPGGVWGRGAATALFILGVATLGTPPVTGQSLTTTQISRQVQGEERLDVTVRYSAGTARLRPTDSRTLYSLRLTYDPDRVRPLHEYADGRATLGIDRRGTGGIGPFLRGGFPDAEMDLTLSTRIPMDLALELGAVEAELDLGGLRLRTLRLETGASTGELRVSAPNPEAMETVQIRVGAASFHARELGNLNAAQVEVEAGVGDIELDFAGLRRTETEVRVHLGVGSLEIRVPEEAGLRLTRDSFLTSFEAPGLEARDGALYSTNWEAAERRIRLDVDASFGTVTVVRVPD